MRCPYCQKKVNPFSAQWRLQPQKDGTRKCPNCEGVVKNVFDGPISLGILAATIALVVVTKPLIPFAPSALWGFIGGAAIFLFALRLVKAGQPS